MESTTTNWFKRRQSPIDAGFLIGVAALVVVGVLSLRTAVNQRKESRWVEHSYQVLRELDQAHADLDVTREASATDDDFAARMTRLRTLTRDNPEQQARLDSIGHMLPLHPEQAL